MTTQTEALKLALEALEMVKVNADDWQERTGKEIKGWMQPVNHSITAIKEALAQPEQKQNLKLMPREATREMLEAMDECSMEGYDERLYAGHAGSVYMAAWDAFYGQHCYCGDITSLGVIHRDDGPCHYPDHKESKPEQDKERCVGCESCIDTACGRDECPKGWPKAAQPEQEPVAYLYHDANSLEELLESERKCLNMHSVLISIRRHEAYRNETPLYTTPPQRKPITEDEFLKLVEKD